MRWHLMKEIEERGAEAVVDDAISEALDGPDAVYLSVDIDVIDPGMAPGTGTPEPGGLLTRELLRAIRRIAARVELAGMDIVEVSPPYDHADVTAAGGSSLRARGDQRARRAQARRRSDPLRASGHRGAPGGGATARTERRWLTGGNHASHGLAPRRQARRSLVATTSISSLIRPTWTCTWRLPGPEVAPSSN